MTNRLEYAVFQVTPEITYSMIATHWQNKNEEELWYELVSCLLGSGVTFEHSQAVVQHLKINGFLAVSEVEDYEKFELNIRSELERPMYPHPKVTHGAKYRFPNVRAHYLRKTAETLYGKGGSIKDLLTCSNNMYEARKMIMSHASGIGPKQSSMFLRNIGYCDELAILDSHVLRYMYYIGLIEIPIKSISNMSFYQQTERMLQDYSQKWKVKLSCLDTAIWVVMRVFQKEFAI